jgi:hypothetical protein
MKMSLDKKGLVVGVILLFVGVAIAPTVTSSNELIDVTVEAYGIGGAQPHTVQLTQQEADEMKILFDGIEQSLSNAQSRKEANTIVENAIVELDKYGLLGDLTVQQAQQLIIGDEYQQRLLERLDEKFHNGIFKANYLCLITGHLSTTCCFGPFVYIAELLGLEYYNVDFPVILGLLMIICFWYIMPIILTLSPIHCSAIVTAGWYWDEWWAPEHFIPAQGKIITFGLTGLKYWSGDDLYGNASKFDLIHYIGGPYNRVNIFYPAFLPYMGITVDSEGSLYFLGFALKAELSHGL